jgi:predicted DNA-binding transcriptional regulator YafY
MNRFERALAILLLLRGGKPISAPELARRLGVSTRTIYRDIDILSAVGVPVYAEATSLLTGLALLRRLQARPFAADLETSAQKLLSVVPDQRRAILEQLPRIIGFERLPDDIFHPEQTQATEANSTPADGGTLTETEIITTFLQCRLERRAVALAYRSPYRARQQSHVVAPCGLIWDRDRWYLVGRLVERNEAPRLWRADRVLAIVAQPRHAGCEPDFDVARLLGRTWLQRAMRQWIVGAPVKIRLTREQADRLRRDWYYGSAQFDRLTTGDVLMTFGESDHTFVFELLRWLGPGAELVEPDIWRAAFTAELRAMLAAYEPIDSTTAVHSH